MTNLNEMFATATTTSNTTANARSLAGTAQLTSVAADLTVKTLNIITTTEDVERAEQLKANMQASMTDHNAMDALLNDICPLNDVDITFLKSLDSAVLDSMLKSQQSKRSRSKGKVMTADNYKTLMTGAIAENLLRMAMNKEKQNGGRTAGTVGYTDAEIQELIKDQDKLRKVLRNVQSKKSIMKSKEGFSEKDERWLELLATEEMLKGLRDDNSSAPRVDKTKLALRELFDIQITSEKPLDKMNKTDLLNFIEKIAALCADEEPVAEENKAEENPEA